MTRKQKRPAGTGKIPLKKETPVRQKAEEADEEACRCKEVAKKSPAEMLKLMIDDLTFWKKEKKK